ncbi:MAG: hypothetical protein PHE24_04595 [Patescibacteria group bacterium]|nr:hypothetical protein [Patescibacteria group bacterium]
MDRTLFFLHSDQSEFVLIHAVAATTKEEALNFFKKSLPRFGWKKGFTNNIRVSELFEAHEFWAREPNLKALHGNWDYTVKQLKDAYKEIVEKAKLLLKKKKCGKVLKVYYDFNHC